MDNTISSQFEQKVQVLIDKYKELKEENQSLTEQVSELVTLKENNAKTISELQDKVKELEDSLAAKNQECSNIEKKADEYYKKLSNYEDVTKSTTSQIDNILSQLTKL